MQEVVLSSEQDAFFKSNMYENFGDIGLNIKRMVDEFQQVAKSNQNIQTIGLYELNWQMTTIALNYHYYLLVSVIAQVLVKV